MRIDWPHVLQRAGFADIQMDARPEWHEAFTRVYRVALDSVSPATIPYSPTCKMKPGIAFLWRI
jgi:hypothetical protein